jgi:protein TonB
MKRVSYALVASACAHAALLANAAFVPTIGELSLLAAAQPLHARLAPAPAQNSPDAQQQLLPERHPVEAKPLAQSGERLSPPAGLPGAPLYYRASELDERAIPLNQVDVVYPETALAAGTGGVVTLRLLIDHEGRLRDASVTDSRPAGVFENAALDAVWSLRFRPAMRNGVAVGSIKLIEVPFDPDCKRTGSCIE